MQRRGLPVLDVHAHLDPAGPGKLEAERAHAREAAVALPDRRRDRARIVERRAAKVDVERDQRTPRADDHAARGRMEVGRPEVRVGALREPARQLLGAAPAEERRARGRARARRRGRPAGRARRCAGRLAGPPPSPAPCRSAAAAPRGRRRRRRSAGARPRGGRGRSGRGRLDASTSAATSASSSPTTVNTERWWSASEWTSSNRTPRGQRGADRLDRGRIAPLREVRHRLERQHGPTLGGAGGTP